MGEPRIRKRRIRIRKNDSGLFPTPLGYDAALQGMKPGVDTTLRPLPAGAAGAMQVRTINHVKVVTHPDRLPIAKVYLYAGFIWPAPRARAALSANGRRVRLHAAAG